MKNKTKRDLSKVRVLGKDQSIADIINWILDIRDDIGSLTVIVSTKDTENVLVNTTGETAGTVHALEAAKLVILLEGLGYV